MAKFMVVTSANENEKFLVNLDNIQTIHRFDRGYDTVSEIVFDFHHSFDVKRAHCLVKETLENFYKGIIRA